MPDLKYLEWSAAIHFWETVATYVVLGLIVLTAAAIGIHGWLTSVWSDRKKRKARKP